MPTADSFAMVRDAVSGRAIVLGTPSPSPPFAWTWNGSTWTDAGIPPVPSGTTPLHAAVWDVVRDRLVVLGAPNNGTLSTGSPVTVWEWDRTSWTTRTAPGMVFTPLCAMTYDLYRQRCVLIAGTLVDETWEYDGLSFTRVQTAQVPVVRTAARLTFDLLRGRTILFAGDPGATAPTWEYDGIDWHRVATAQAPAVDHFAMDYDYARGRTVLFGGRLLSTLATVDETWEYDGVGWVRVSSAVSPSPRQTTACFDSSRQAMVVFGGLENSSVGPAARTFDTWEYDASGWTLRQGAPAGQDATAFAYDSLRSRALLHGGNYLYRPMPTSFQWDAGRWLDAGGAAGPAARLSPVAVFDSRGGRTVMFGGTDGTVDFDETWLWEPAGGWTLASPTARPPARYQHAMAYDATRGRVVMFGGYHRLPTSFWFADTWEFDGGAWTQVATANAPTARVASAMAHDLGRGRTVLFGGRDSFGFLPRQDTWEYDGANWTRILTAHAPASRSEHGLAYDPVRGTTVVAGGINQGVLSRDTWEYDGVDWVQTDAGAEPFQGGSHRLAYDTRVGAMLRTDGSSLWQRADAPSASVARFGRGCGPQAPDLAAAAGALPQLGSAFGLQLGALTATAGACYLGFGLDPLHGTVWPVPLDAVGLPGCLLWTTVDFGSVVLHGGGSAAVPVPIPADPRMAGLIVGVQALEFDATAPGGFGRTSNGLLLRLR
ncbi:MAG: hypothetical protein AB7O97_06955 [Planctomycetota bacterium]